MLPVRSGPRLEPDDAHPKITQLSHRDMRPQRLHHSLGDLAACRFGCRTPALSQDRTGNHTLAEPTDEINFPYGLTQATEDPGRGRVGQLATSRARAKRDEDEKQRSSGTLGTPALDSQEMPERRLVVGMTSRATRKLGVAGKGFGHHGSKVSARPRSKTAAIDRRPPAGCVESCNSLFVNELFG
jgi:hypothetical protein